jgi:hypothetical protein
LFSSYFDRLSGPPRIVQKPAQHADGVGECPTIHTIDSGISVSQLMDVMTPPDERPLAIRSIGLRGR